METKEDEQGLIYGLRCVFSPLWTKIRDTTLPGMESDISEHFSPNINFKTPEKGYYVSYQNEFIFKKLGIDTEIETAFRVEQTSDTVCRTFHFIQKNFTNYVIIDYDNLEKPVKWSIKGTKGKTDSESKENILVLPNVHITVKSQVTPIDDGFIFNIEGGQTQVLLHIETFPLYEEFERTAIIADSSQVDEVAAVLGFFPDNKYVPVIFFENKENEIMRMNADSKQLKNRREIILEKRNITEKRKQILNHMFELHPENIIILNSLPEIEDLNRRSSMINAKVHQLTDPASGNCLSLEKLSAKLSMVFDKEFNFFSVENHEYLAIACVLARIKGTSSKAFIPVIQKEAKHDYLRIGSAGYGDSEYCGELTDVTGKLMHKLSKGSEEGVLVEYDGKAQSIMRTILASNYAYFNKTVPVIVDKVSVVSDLGDINQDLKLLDDYYKFIEYIQHYKAEILNEDEIKSSNDPRDIKTLDFIKSIDVNHEISSKAIEKYDLEKIIVWINIHGVYLPDGSIEISKKIKSKLLKVSEKITASLGNSIQLFHDFKYITAFTDGTPYNLAKCGDELWATRFAIGHFVEDEVHKAAAILLNLVMYSKGRDNPIKRILQVAPYASEDSMFKITRQDDAFATTRLDTGEVKRKWALTFELINDKCDKDTLIELGKNISWFNMHFGTHGSGSSIALGKNAELKLNEILDFNLSHTLIDLNACQTYPFAGKEILSSGAAGGYATLFIVKDTTADEIGKGVFKGTLNHIEPSESLRENIKKVVKAGSDGISEFAYVHIGLPRLRPFLRDIMDFEEKDIQRMKYNDVLTIVRDWIKNKRIGQDACFQNFKRQKEEYLKTIAEDDREELLRLFFDEGVLEYDLKSFNNAIELFNKAYAEIKDIDDKTGYLRYIELNYIKSTLLLQLIRALCSMDRFDDANDKLKELEYIALQFPQSEKINLLFVKGLFNFSKVLGGDGKLKELERLAFQFPASEAINGFFANELYNRSKVLGGAGRFGDANDRLKELKKIALRFPVSVQINHRYAIGLFNLFKVLDQARWIKEAEGNIKELGKLVFQFPESEQINHIFARGLFNFSKVSGDDGKLKELEKIAFQFPASEDINRLFAKELYNRSKVLGEAGRFGDSNGRLKELKKIALRSPVSEGITLRFKEKHINLPNDLGSTGWIKEVEGKIKELEYIAFQFPASEQINYTFAEGLYYLYTVLGGAGRFDDANDRLKELEYIALQFPESEQINITFARGLFNFSKVFGGDGRFGDANDRLKELENIALRFPASKQINLLFVKGLFNFTPDLDRVSKIEEDE
ncbi:MAG TPA: hypothetical protein VER35_01880 [Candidatus Limnocylindrales bacterium]|nr:hypothetical protein [Candidatus Limnocylindrales bacterium]